MLGPLAVRDVAVAFLVATATAAGLVALTPWPWTITLPASLVFGAVSLIADILLFSRPTSLGTSSGRRSLAVVGTVAGMSALGLAFSTGRNSQPSSETYPFIVTSAGGITTILKAAPFESAQKNSVVTSGDSRSVDCYVTQRDGRWYRLSENQGWLRGDELVPAPYTGLASPPQCPS
jgi:hypothetical protein